MVGVSVITGGGTGIGAALAKQLASRGQRVLIVGRRSGPLESTKASNPESIQYIVADIATTEGRDSVVQAINDAPYTHLSFLVHNAGRLEPVVPLSNVTEKEWRDTMAINVDAPLFLTQALLPKLKANPEDGGARVLHISSGASQKPYRGWGAYCTSKAALNMVYRVLRDELKPHNIHVGSVRPGVVDTPMQDIVRESDPKAFPDLPRFQNLKDTGELLPPKQVATFLDWLLHKTTPEEFAHEEWDIRDHHHQHLWSTST